MKCLTLLAAALLLTGCAGAVKPDAPARAVAPAPAGIPDDRIGLSPGDIDHVGTPDPPAENASGPGELPVTPSAYPGAPPPISHGVAEFLPITPDENYCIACHAVDEKVEGGPTPMPESHYVDIRNAPDAVREEVAGARYVCSSCHVVRTDARPLVDNRFGRR